MAIEEKKERSYDGIAPKIEKVTEQLSTELNDVEWQNRARELADAHKATEATEENKKSIMAELNADLKVAKAKESKLANIVANRREIREVTVEVTYDYEKGVVIRKRTDSDEEISRRDMTTTERQSGLFDELDEAEEGVTDANDFIHSVHEDNKDVNTKAPGNA